MLVLLVVVRVTVESVLCWVAGGVCVSGVVVMCALALRGRCRSLAWVEI